MDLKTLRIHSDFTAARAAELARVSVRTWRRWENESGCRLAELWLRRELGIVPGWPNGWRAVREGVFIPGLGVSTIPEIEGRGAVWQLIREDLRAEAARRYDSVISRACAGA